MYACVYRIPSFLDLMTTFCRNFKNFKFKFNLNFIIVCILLWIWVRCMFFLDDLKRFITEPWILLFFYYYTAVTCYCISIEITWHVIKILFSNIQISCVCVIWYGISRYLKSTCWSHELNKWVLQTHKQQLIFINPLSLGEIIFN